MAQTKYNSSAGETAIQLLNGGLKINLIRTLMKDG